jgi:hypothetical protein
MPKIMSSHLRLDVTLADARYSPSQRMRPYPNAAVCVQLWLHQSGGDEAVSGFIRPRFSEKSPASNREGATDAHFSM